MKIPHFDRREAILLSILFLFILIAFKIAFYYEGIGIVRMVLALFWLFVLPGYALTFSWKEKLSFVERVVVGSALSAGIIGIFSYYFGLIGIHIQHHYLLLPFLLVVGGIALSAIKR